MNLFDNYEIYKDINIKKYNTYRLDVIVKYLVFVRNINELVSLIKIIKSNNIKYVVLGNGSNVIFKDSYYDGVVIKLDKLNNIEINDNIVKVESGVSLIKLSSLCIDNNLKGLEFAYGIPGLVGASTAMNAGAYNKDMASVIKEVKVLDKDLNIVTMSNKELNFKYRDSFLKHNKDYICLEVTMELERGDKDTSLSLVEERRIRRMESQPLEYPSAGSVFRNPTNMHAGALIEECGLKGYSINGATVSEKHANFIINTGGCTGKDIIELINLIKNKVYEKYNVNLILEQEIIE